MRKLMVITSAFIAVAASAVISAHATYKGKNGLIAYQQQVSAHVQLITVQPDGSGTHQLTALTDSDATNASWSPDGNKIAFQREWGPNKVRIYTMNADGSGLHEFDRTLRGNFAWLPDGKGLLLVKGLRWSIVTASGTRPRDAGIPGSGDSPCILPDGKRVAMIATLGRTDGKAAIFVGRIGGGHGSLKRITPWQSMTSKIDCSPDGSKVAFTAPDTGTSQSSNVYTVGIEGSGLRQLTHNRGGRIDSLLDSWSPDGTKIAFASNLTGTYQIYTMNADGTGIKQLTQGGEAHLAAWGTHP